MCALAHASKLNIKLSSDRYDSKERGKGNGKSNNKTKDGENLTAVTDSTGTSSSNDIALKKFVLPKGYRSLPENKSSSIINVPLTKTHFLDAYSKAKWNLSKVPCPSCFEGIEMMPAPDHYNEDTRMKAVKKFSQSDQWKDREVFNKLIGKAVKTFHAKGAAISLLDGKRQIVKYQTQLNIGECRKHISIDAHTILSADYLVLMDASKDWRTAKNPLVKGAPNIRFYVGVPLVTDTGASIGVFSVFDTVPRTGEVDRMQIDSLKDLAEQVIDTLSSTDTNKPVNTTVTVPLLQLIGRPTSQTNQFSTRAVYEKDGSGSSYSQNFNYCYNIPTMTSTTLIQQSSNKNGSPLDYSPLSKLYGYRDIKTASLALSKIIISQLKFDFVCIIEIRVSQKYRIPNEFFPHENSVDAENFRFGNKMVLADNEQIMTRFLGSYGYRENSSDFEQLKSSDFFYGCLRSEFGVFYENVRKNSNIKFKSGISMPFYRIISKIVRRKKVVKNEIDKKKDGKPIEVYLRSGGYLVAAFHDNSRKISVDEMNFIYSSACTLRRAFISN